MGARKLPLGNIASAVDVGKVVSGRRKAQGLTQAELAGLGRVGLRFVGDLERGKETVQLDKVMQVLDLLGLDLIIVERGS